MFWYNMGWFGMVWVFGLIFASLGSPLTLCESLVLERREHGDKRVTSSMGVSEFNQYLSDWNYYEALLRRQLS